MKSQNATATLGNITSCSGEDILVPLDVNNFNEVGAMTFYIGYDTNTAEFLSLQNINPAIPGNIAANASNGQVSIAYSSTEPFYISGEKLFDLSFHFPGDSTFLPFNPGTEIANINLEIIPLDTYPGSIENPIQLIDQPDSIQSYPDHDVIFRITSLGEHNYQWQENTGNGWNNLQNNSIYSGVTTDTLTIYDVPLSFNGNIYRCIMTAGNCEIISDAALLEVALAFPVASLGFVSSCPEMEILEPVFAGDLFDIVEFTFNVSYNTDFLAFHELLNIHPELETGNLSTSPMTDPPGIIIHWDADDAVSITSGKLFDLAFYYGSLNHQVAFEEGSVVINSSSNIINITLNNGAISQYSVPLINAQPQNDTVTQNESAYFTVSSTDTDEYAWLISTNEGNSWNSLSDNPPYYNTNTPTLTINPAVYSMNGNLFACRLDNEYCTVYSLPAMLTVDTLTYIGGKEAETYLQVYPVPFKDVLHIDMTEKFIVSRTDVYDMGGKLLYSINLNQSHGSKESEIDLSALKDGIFFIKITGTINGETAFEMKKIIKTN